MRVPLIAGNWKMHKTVGEAVDFINQLKPEVADVKNAEILICPTFTALYAVGQAIKDSKIEMGAQDVFWNTKGAYTGEISPLMLTDVGCTYVIIGHSETRGRFGVVEEGMTPALQAYFGGTDESVNKKLHAAIAAGLKPIVCVGETLAERNAGKADEIIQSQVKNGLAGITQEQAASMVIAYEPVWAIGTGETCDTPEAERVCGMIRKTMATLFGESAAQSMRVQYGGSVKPANAKELLSQPNIDGALVGGAALKVPDFAAIVKSA
ncbi:MAG: triose-phosphate isomerase [Armatimonadota bacterium]|nr:triose-phosphate isomerase [Armatimonadota bacterium]